MPRENKKNAPCIYDENDPDSIFHMVPGKVQMGLRRINPSWVDWTEKTYKRKFKIKKVDEVLRLRFWQEYDSVVSMGRSKMIMNNVWRGVCSEQYWKQCVLDDPGKMGFVMVRPQQHEDSLQLLYLKGLEAIEEILNMPTDHRNIAKKLDAFKYLDQRLNGGIVQKIESRNLNVNKEIKAPSVPRTVKEIDAEIKALESGKHKLLPESDGNQPVLKGEEQPPEAVDQSNHPSDEEVIDV